MDLFLRSASHTPWRVRTALHACVQSWEWPGHSTSVLQPTGRNSLSACHQGVAPNVSCPDCHAIVARQSSSLAGAGALVVRPVEDAQRPVTFRSFLRQQSLCLEFACLRLVQRVFGSFQPVLQGNHLCPQTFNGCLVLKNLFPCFALLLGCLLRGLLCPGVAATCHRLLNGLGQQLLQRRAHHLLQPRFQLCDRCPRVHCHCTCPSRVA